MLTLVGCKTRLGRFRREIEMHGMDLVVLTGTFITYPGISAKLNFRSS